MFLFMPERKYDFVDVYIHRQHMYQYHDYARFFFLLNWQDIYTR